MPEITGQTNSVDSTKSTANLKQLPKTIITSLVFLMVLSVGVVISLAMVSKSQDLRRDASSDFNLAVTQPFTCDWCGTLCQQTGTSTTCPEIAPAANQSCVVSAAGGSCEIIITEPSLTPIPTNTPAPSPTLIPTVTLVPTTTPTAVPLPTSTPLPTTTPPPVLSCDWCGTECQPTASDRACILIAPPIGYSCGVSANGQNCEIKKIGCIRKSECMFADPACEIKLQPNYVFCADSDLNGDSLVNQSDFDLLSMHFFDSSPADLMYDINHDKKIDIFDYSVMVKEWTK